MLSDEPIDEDLEALLYAQVYYGKSEETELPDLRTTELDRDGKDQSEILSKGTHPSRNWYQKKRYFENNLVQEDKKKENEDTPSKETTSNHLTKSPNNSNTTSTKAESDIVAEDSETSIQDQTELAQKNKDLETPNTQQHQIIEISTSTPYKNPQNNSTQVVTPVPLLSTPKQSHQLHLLNNITINQYLYPPNFIERLRSSTENHPLSKRCQRDLKKLKKGDISEQEFFNNLKRRLKIQKKQHQQIVEAFLKKQESIAQSEVICLSDSDDSDIEVVEVTNISKPSNKEFVTMKGKVSLEETVKNSADDDEIIYVAPPPVPVINIDTESDSEKSDMDQENSKNDIQNLQTNNEEASSENIPNSQLDVDETSNDFLQPKNTPEGFNFSLHGSDFQNTDFVRPANPTDVYETESSTSTSDFNRDSSRQFCNSVKTIVFNEVDFPNQGIFDDTNLESFGDFITPRRQDKEKHKEKAPSAADTGTMKENKRVFTRTSSESSSESDYESSNTHKNLPDLSPMVCTVTSPKKGQKTKKKTDEAPKRKKAKTGDEPRTNKKKSKDKFSKENEGILDAEETNNAEELVRKLKRKSCDSLADDEVTPRKKSKKKKNKHSNKNVEENKEIVESTADKTTSCTSPRKRSTTPKKLADDEIDTSHTSDELSRKKNKKKKRNDRNEDSHVQTDNLTDHVEPPQELLDVERMGESTEDGGKRKGRKKRGKELSASKNSEEGKTLEDQSEILEEDCGVVSKEQERAVEDNGKKKNKKRKQKEPIESRKILEGPTINKSEFSKDQGEQNNSENTSKTQEIQSETLDESNTKKKGKKKKRVSSDKRSDVEESSVVNIVDINIEDAEKRKVQNIEAEKLVEQGNTVEIARGEEMSNETNVKEYCSQDNDEDIIIIEKAIPTHTIESSESDQDDDILSIEDVELDLELGNISSNTNNADEVIDMKNFDVDYMQSKMSDDPEKWKILPSDQAPLNLPKKGPRCNRCRQFGHIAIRCTNKPAIPICTLCGGNGHQEPRCPNKVCFTCGKPGIFSTVYCYVCVKQRKMKCNLCSITGHKTDYCPDLWRRYFLTTTEGNLTEPKRNCSTLKPRMKQWCSGCASNGHLEFECNSYKWIREYPAASPHIFKYQDVYPKRVHDVPKKKTNFSSTPAESPINPVEDRNRISNKSAESLDSADGQNENQQNLAIQTTSQTSTENQTSETNLALLELSNRHNAQFETAVTSLQQGNTNQVQTFPQSANSSKFAHQSKRKSPRNTKINPLSVLRQPLDYNPYQSVLNPYSLLGASAMRPAGGLFNPVPSNIVAQQLMNLANYPQYPGNYNQNHYQVPLQNEPNFYQAQQFGLQVPPNENPYFYDSPNVFQDCMAPNTPESYYNVQGPPNMYGNREFLNRPHTITRNPTEESYFQLQEDFSRNTFAIDPMRQREREFNLPIAEDNFTRGNLRDRLSHPRHHDPNFNSSDNQNEFPSKLDSYSNEQLKKFISGELKKLKSFQRAEPRSFKRRLNTINHLKKIEIKTNSIKKQINFLYKQINMYLFGVRKLCAGSENLNCLRSFVGQNWSGVQSTSKRRRDVLQSYDYIFGGEHLNFNYRQYLNSMTVKVTNKK